jgi:hypothetical protein
MYHLHYPFPGTRYKVISRPVELSSFENEKGTILSSLKKGPNQTITTPQFNSIKQILI